MTLTTVQNAAEAIAGNNVLSITSLANNQAYVVRFSNNNGLLHFGQTLLQHAGGSVGLVFRSDGTVPEEAEAQRLVYPDDQASLADRVGEQDRCEYSAARILGALDHAYSDEPQVPAHMITHALGDLRHLCDQLGFEFAALDKNAYHIYLAEKADRDG